MTDYTKSTNFATKDSLPSGNPSKIVKGTEINTEFDNIAVAVATKSDKASPSFTGTLTAVDLTVTGNTVLGNAATDTVTITADVASNIIPSADSTYSLGDSSNYWSHGYMDAATITGNLAIGGDIAVTGNATITGNLTFGNADTDSITLTAEIASHITPDVDDTYDLGTATKEWRNIYVDGTAYVDNIELNGTVITATGAELNTLDGITATVAELNTLDGITATVAELNTLDGITATVTELNYTDGVTSNIQTQLNAKQPLDAGLTSISGLTTAADKMIYTTALDTYAVTSLSSFGRSLIDDADAATARTTLGLVIGTNVQAYDAQLADVAGLTPTDGNFIVGNGTNFVAESGATARASLGLTIGTDVQAYDADTAKYDDVTANFTGTLQNAGSNVVVDSDVGSTVQAYDSNLTSFVGTFTLPTTDSTAGYVLKTDGAGTLSFVAPSSYDESTVAITGGTIDGVTIGGTTAAAGTFTTLAGTTSVVAASDMTITSGSIVSASGAISFGNENLSTTGTLASGALTVTGVVNANISTSNIGYIATSTDANCFVQTVDNTGNAAFGNAGNDFVVFPASASERFRVANSGLVTVTGNQTITSSETTGNALSLGVGSLTSGAGMSINASSASFSGFALDATVTNASATGRVARFYNAGTGNGIFIDQNGNGDALVIDSEAAGSQSINIDAVNTSNQTVDIRNAAAQTSGGLMYLYHGHASTTTPVLWVENTGTGNGIFIDQNGNGIALNIDSEATSQTGINAQMATTTGTSFQVQSDSLTSGNNGWFYTNGSSFSGINLRATVDHASATGIALQVQNDGTGDGIFIDQNGNGQALSIDSESSTAYTIYANAATTTTSSFRYITDSLTSGTAGYFSTGSASYTGTGGLFRVGITNGSASGHGLRVDNSGTGYGLFIDQNGNGNALNIDAENTTSDVVQIVADTATTGRGLYVYSNSGSFTNTNGFFNVVLDNASASGNAARFKNDGTGYGAFIDQNGTSASEALYIDAENTTGYAITATVPTTAHVGRLVNEHATSPQGLYLHFPSASPDNNTQNFLLCIDSTATRCIIYSDGDLANHDGTYGTLSDRYYKSDIVEAREYWDDWKAVQFKTFTKGGKKQFGVIADELETVFPGLVHTSPDENHPDGESQWVDTMNLNHIGGKVLQEALKRIEALEAEIAALKGA